MPPARDSDIWPWIITVQTSTCDIHGRWEKLRGPSRKKGYYENSLHPMLLGSGERNRPTTNGKVIISENWQLIHNNLGCFQMHDPKGSLMPVWETEKCETNSDRKSLESLFYLGDVSTLRPVEWNSELRGPNNHCKQGNLLQEEKELEVQLASIIKENEELELHKGKLEKVGRKGVVGGWWKSMVPSQH